jgi:hypothetical protein
MIYRFKLWFVAFSGGILYWLYSLSNSEQEYVDLIYSTAVSSFCEEYLSNDDFMQLPKPDALTQIYYFSLLYSHNLFNKPDAYNEVFSRITKECLRKYDWHEKIRGL